MPRQPQRPPFSETKLRQALAEASCWSDGLRSMGYEPKGHNIRTVQRWARIWEISTDHFVPNIARGRVMRGYGRPLDTIMVENSTYSRGTLKRRLSITSTASRPTSAFVLAAARHSPRGKRYCSQKCWGTEAATRYSGVPHPELRKVSRSSRDQLLEDVATMSMCAVGRKYGVSDNAVRKWLRWYQSGLVREQDTTADM